MEHIKGPEKDLSRIRYIWEVRIDGQVVYDATKDKGVNYHPVDCICDLCRFRNRS